MRFHHALLADAAARLGDAREVHDRLAAAWDTVEHARRAGGGGRAPAARRRGDPDGRRRRRSRLRGRCASWSPPASRSAPLACCGKRARSAPSASTGLSCARAWPSTWPNVLSWLGDLDPALSLYQEAAELARGCADPLTCARAEAGADLWVTAFVPDLPRVRRLEDALDALPPQELRLRATLLGRLTIVAGADVDATDQVRAWADEAVAVARATGDPVLIAQALIDQTMSAKSRSEVDGDIVAADEVVRLAERAGRSDLALHGHQRRAGHYLNRGDLGAASESLGQRRSAGRAAARHRRGARARCSSAPRSSH